MKLRIENPSAVSVFYYNPGILYVKAYTLYLLLKPAGAVK